jgi:ElaB/YqjD/DUF883 family membrane-anchored ribosome-binding protein
MEADETLLFRASSAPDTALAGGRRMAASNFDTSMKGAGQAANEAARETGRGASGLYEQAKTTASDVYDSASEMAQDAVTRAQDGAADLDEMVSEQVGRHPKAMVALSIGVGFALGLLFASMRREPEPWYERYRR